MTCCPAKLPKNSQDFMDGWYAIFVRAVGSKLKLLYVEQCNDRANVGLTDSFPRSLVEYGWGWPTRLARWTLAQMRKVR